MDKENDFFKGLLVRGDALANATFQIDFDRGKITGGFAPFVRADGQLAQFLVWGEIARIWTEKVSTSGEQTRRKLTEMKQKVNFIALCLPKERTEPMKILWDNQMMTLREVRFVDEAQDQRNGVVCR